MGLAVTAGTVVVVGSINMDLTVRVEELPRPGQTVLGGDVVHGTGGKGANQAVAASRAGATSLLIGAVGEDAAGAAALAALAAEGVDTSGVQRVPQRPTGTALIVVDRAGENQIAVASGANRNLTGSVVRELLKPLQAKRFPMMRWPRPRRRRVRGVGVSSSTPRPSGPFLTRCWVPIRS